MPWNADPGRGRRNHLWIGLAKFALVGIILWWLYQRGEVRPERLRQALEHWPMFLAASAITLFGTYIQGFRWLGLLKSRHIEIPATDAFDHFMQGKFFNLIVPGYVGADLIRGLHAIRTHPGSRSTVIASLLADRVLGVFTMLTLAASGLLLRPALLRDPRLRALSMICLGAMIAAVAGFIVLRVMQSPPAFVLNLARHLHLDVAIDVMYSEGRHYARSTPLLLRALGVTLFVQGVMIASFYLLGQSLGMGDVTVLDFVVFASCGMLATMLPVAPMGLGVGQLAFLALFQFAHSDQGGNLYSLYFLMISAISLLGGFFYMRDKSGSRAARGQTLRPLHSPY